MEKIERKSLLYKTKVEYGDFTINHVQGCAHGCTYPCYAMMMARHFGWAKSYDEWRKPKIVANALDLLDIEIPKLKDKIKFVHLCFSTDPFMMGHDEVIDLSIKIIRKLNSNGIKVTTLTKGLYPKALQGNAYSTDNEYGITLVSLSERHRVKFEPYSAPYEDRIGSLRKMHEAGLKTWASIEPFPTPNIINQDFTGILDKLAFVDRLVFGRLNYSKDVSLYPDNSGFYKECVREVRSFCANHKIGYLIKRETLK